LVVLGRLRVNQITLHVVTIHWNPLVETIPMNGHSIGIGIDYQLDKIEYLRHCLIQLFLSHLAVKYSPYTAKKRNHRVPFHEN